MPKSGTERMLRAVDAQCKTCSEAAAPIRYRKSHEI